MAWIRRKFPDEQIYSVSDNLKRWVEWRSRRTVCILRNHKGRIIAKFKIPRRKE